MAHVDATLVQKNFYISEGKRKPDAHRHRKADDLRAGFEIAERRTFCHNSTLRNHPSRLKPVLSDTALQTVLIPILLALWALCEL